MNTKQYGFTLVELMIVLVISGMFATWGLKQLEAKSTDSVVDNASVKAIMVADAAKRYRLATGSWPPSITQLVDGNYITTAQATSAFNTPYTFSVSGTGLNERLIITNQASDNRYARRMAGVLPDGSDSGSSFSFMIPPPGLEASLSALYARDGSRPLTGAMDANNNDINNVRILGATTVNATNITATGTVRGGRVFSTGNVDADVNLTAGQNIHAGRDLFVGQHAVVNGYAEIKGDVYARNNLTVTSTAQAGSIQSLGSISATTDITATRDVSGNRDVYAGRYMYADRYLDKNNTARYLDPGSTSNLEHISVNGALYLEKDVLKGSACSPKQIGLDENGNILTCINRRWSSPGSGGSTVLTGFIENNQQIPLPDGFTESQCTWSASMAKAVGNPNSTWNHNPSRYGGFKVEMVDRARKFTCGSYDDGTYHQGSKCLGTYVISCS